MRAALPVLLVPVFLVLVFCAGCGQKGPLYLRDKPPANVKPPKPEPFKPVPYPNEAGEDDSANGAKK